MEAITITNNPAINLLVDDTYSTNNPVLEVQANTDHKEAIFHQILLYSEFELDQAAEIHKLIVFHSPSDSNQKIDWSEELDENAFASAEHDPYEREQSRPMLGPEPPPKYPVPNEYYSWTEDDNDDLDFEEELAREFEEQEKES